MYFSRIDCKLRKLLLIKSMRNTCYSNFDLEYNWVSENLINIVRLILNKMNETSTNCNFFQFSFCSKTVISFLSTSIFFVKILIFIKYEHIDKQLSIIVSSSSLILLRLLVLRLFCLFILWCLRPTHFEITLPINKWRNNENSLTYKLTKMTLFYNLHYIDKILSMKVNILYFSGLMSHKSGCIVILKVSSIFQLGLLGFSKHQWIAWIIKSRNK